jgi:hypothetical protein
MVRPMRDRKVPPPPDTKRCLVEATARGHEWSVRFGPGQLVDLNAVVAPGLRVRDVVDPTWFEPLIAADRESQ